MWIDPTEIDVNAHPAKTEIRFRNNQLVHTILVDQISRALKDFASRRFFGREHSHSQMLRTELSGQIELPMENPLTFGSSSSGMIFSKNKKRISEVRDLPPRGSLKHKKTQKISVFPQENQNAEILPKTKKSQDSASTITLETPDSAPGNLPENGIRNLCLISPLPEIPKNIRVLSQFRKTYIISENEAGLVLIDQQMLHKRLIYDIFFESLKKKDVQIQTFKVSLLLELSPKQSVLLQQSIEPLFLSGFAVSPFGGNTFAVDTIPEFLIEDQVEKVIRGILDRLALFVKQGKIEEILKEVCHVVAEHGAMITEQELTKSEMECLLAQWEELGCPTFSIKEAPIMVKFSLKELEKRLSR